MKTVLTNGCFDILTEAHVELLRFARSQGDKLIVGMNSDASVRLLKGPNRPINTQDTRKKILLALKSVDQVVVFNATDITGLLIGLHPNIWVKGGDYTLETLNPEEIRVAKERDIKIVLARKITSLSTTDIIEKVYKIYEKEMAQNNPPPQT